jgi:hypothetical protein
VALGDAFNRENQFVITIVIKPKSYLTTVESTISGQFVAPPEELRRSSLNWAGTLAKLGIANANQRVDGVGRERAVTRTYNGGSRLPESPARSPDPQH